MSPALARLLARLYPRPWRERYGAEFEALLLDGRGGLGTAANVVWSAVCERISPTRLPTCQDAGKWAITGLPNKKSLREAAFS